MAYKIKNRLEENYKIMRDKAEENAALAVRLLKVPPKGKK